MYRVNIEEGDIPIIIVAPHGPDDSNTDFLAEQIASNCGAYAVINNGWCRSPIVDPCKDKANCNDVQHLFEDVVKDEFLDPILRYVARCKKHYGYALIFIIHGCGNYVRTYANDPKLDAIIGYGNGKPPSYSCDPRLKDAFIHHLDLSGITAYEGKAGGMYSGRKRNNLNQFFRRWQPDSEVHSLQLEIVHELRENKNMCELTAYMISTAIDSLLDLDDTTDLITMPPRKF